MPGNICLVGKRGYLLRKKEKPEGNALIFSRIWAIIRNKEEAF